MRSSAPPVSPTSARCSRPATRSGTARRRSTSSRRAYAAVRELGYELVNADCVLIGEEPRLAPHRLEMRARLSAALDVDELRVAVRATTTDRLGFTGRGEGLAAQSVALLSRA
jgi:2-C-methyl-D-erythritol 2,4-cyclodiphosphate synthase